MNVLSSLYALSFAGTHPLPPFIVTVDSSTLFLSVAHQNEPSRSVLATVGHGRPFLQASQTKLERNPVTGDGGYNCGFDADKPLRKCERIEWTTRHQTASVRTANSSMLVLIGMLQTGSEPSYDGVGSDGEHGATNVSYELKIAPDSSDTSYIHFEARVVSASDGSRSINSSDFHTSTQFTFASVPEERFFGFGQQYSVWDHKGVSLPLMVTEQGIGRGLEPLTSVINEFGGKCGGNRWTSYGPSPLFISAQPGADTVAYRALLLEGTHVALFDMHSVSDAVTVQVWAPSIVGRVLYAPTAHANETQPTAMNESAPLALLRGLSAYTGRMAPLPSWVDHGAVVGMEGGRAAVLNLTATLLSAGVPVAALWLQDWTGIRDLGLGERLWWNWESDEASYPDWVGMVAKLRAEHGIRTLSYINPFLVNASGKASGYRRNLLQEASDRGFLVQRSAAAGGGDYLLHSGGFRFGTVDLSNAAAVSWYTQVIVDNMLLPGAGEANATGAVSGWMHDFGEYLPFDAVMASGETAEEWHNRFPEVWAQLGRNATQRAAAAVAAAAAGAAGAATAAGAAGAAVTAGSSERSEIVAAEDEVVFFARSAWTRSPGIAPLFWQGDQLTTWDQFDGLRTVLLGTLSGGLSGRSLSHSDVGGYTMVDESVTIAGHPLGVYYVRDAELLQRWTELSALADALLRTHPGLLSDKVPPQPDPPTLHRPARPNPAPTRRPLADH